MLKFSEEEHSYISLDPNKPVDWVSVTKLISMFKPPFNAKEKAHKAVLNPRSKWFGMDPEKVQSTWTSESKRSTTAGKWYHSKREEALYDQNPLGIMKVFKPIMEGTFKIAPPQKLDNNTLYPEHLSYSVSDLICGQADKVEVINHKVNIDDYKTIKNFKTEGFVNWEGISQKMLQPIDHLDDCHLVHYSLQLSFYLYMILRHNPQLLPGVLTIEHVIFELESSDAYGFPIYRKDDNGGFVVSDIKKYTVPFMKKEVFSMLEFCRNTKTDVGKNI